MAEGTKFCKHCGEVIDADCVVCPKCGKQVEELKGGRPDNIVINNTASSSSSATVPNYKRKMPWYLSWFWIIVFAIPTSGLYLIIGLIMRANWKSHN